MSRTSNLTEKYEEERQRTQEQSQIVYLQGQIDELRRLIKDQSSKYQWAMEQSRKTEAMVAQVQSIAEKHAEETTQMIDRSRRDVLDLRKEISAAMVKINESFEPIRQMQTQIEQLAQARKQDRDQSFGWISRVEELEQKNLSLQAQIKEWEERHRQLAGQLHHLHDADSVALQEIRRVGEDIQVEKQSLRRQAIEAQQLVTDVLSSIEEHDSRISRIDEIRQNIELFAENLPEQIINLEKKFPDINTEIKRVERIATERFLMNQERLEELRRLTEERFAGMQEVEEHNTHQQTTWMERMDTMLHELEQRIVRNVHRLDAVQQKHMKGILNIGEAELQSILALHAAFKEQVERFQQAHDDLNKLINE